MCIRSPGFWLLSALVFNSFASIGWGSHLRDLAVRQDLRGQVCVALADGKITPQERTEILIDAKLILKPEEYKSFKRALDRIAPPPQKSKIPSAKSVAKSTKSKNIAKKATIPSRNQKSREAQSGLDVPAEPTLGPVIPTGATLPDAVVPRSTGR